MSAQSQKRRARRASRHPTPFIVLDPGHRDPLHRQLYNAIRTAIVSGRLPAGSRLPSTRALATETGVSRVTVSAAFDQLRAEGYVEARTGSGTFVREGLPDDALHTRRSSLRRTSPAPPSTAPHVPTAPAKRPEGPTGTSAFRIGLPALDLFPVGLWARIAARRWRGVAGEEAERLLGYGYPMGYDPLRKAIADYVNLSRGVRCEARQVIVTSGAQQALDLVARVLLKPGEAAWLEDPGYFGARETLRAAGAAIVPVPVDDDGLDTAAGEALNPAARLAYVSPSYQFPLGATMTMQRRLALLDWAGRAGAWIVEDDYDGEFRYVGRPLASLQGLDAERSAAGGVPARVLYVGTFSKTLFPSLRLGYVIVPEALVDTFAAAKAALDRHTATVEQAVLADFIEEGHYTRHVRRMRLVYASRQATLIAAAATHLSRWLDLRPAAAGMHLVGWLRPDVPGGVTDEELSEAANAAGVFVTPLSSYRTPAPHDGEHPAPPGGLVFGYAGCSDAMIWDGARRLGRAIEGHLERRSATSECV
ncbi:MAG TPA: PLP-dependent aminotransferase family protein [Longimicrobium sp.]|jgi:GntR family transcriptional regulator/MocR family aminotransferase